MAGEFDYSAEFFDTFAKGRDGFRTSQHAYSHVNALFSACRAYAATKEERYFDAAVSAQGWLVKAHSFPTGGWGPDERFTEPGGLGDSIRSGHSHFETPCGAYATCNLDRSLLEFTGDTSFCDQAERVLVNGFLASLAPQPDGRAFYYSDYSPGATKRYFREVWPCCAGTYGLVAADLGINAFAIDDGGPIVVQFVGSRLKTAIAGAPIEIEQATNFPDEFVTTLTVRGPADLRFTLGIRRPGWCTEGLEITCGGEPVTPRLQSNVWRIAVTPEHTTFTIRLRAALSTSSLEIGGEPHISVMDGPVQLVALATDSVSVPGNLTGDVPHLEVIDGSPHTFDLHQGQQALRFVPYYRVKDEPYTVFLKTR